MEKRTFEKLIYLDAEFVSRLYESVFHVSPETRITRTEGGDAKASIHFFSAGVTSSESRTYSLSITEMLEKLQDEIVQYPSFSTLGYDMDMPSVYCWVEGELGITKVRRTRTTRTITLIGKPDPEKNKDREEFVGEEAFFSFRSGAAKFALSPTDQYFMSGISAFKGLAHLVIDRLSIPSRALIRVFSANTTFGEWVATPLIIYDAGQ